MRGGGRSALSMGRMSDVGCLNAHRAGGWDEQECAWIRHDVETDLVGKVNELVREQQLADEQRQRVWTLAQRRWKGAAKRYLVLCRGLPPLDRFICAEPLGRMPKAYTKRQRKQEQRRVARREDRARQMGRARRQNEHRVR